MTHTRMRGELRFFNEETQRGLIRTTEGARFEVLGSGFAEGQVPVGRCAGTAVDFEVDLQVEGTETESRAVRVSVVDLVPARRARRHSRG